MRFATVRELNQHTSQLLKDEEDIIVTRNGKPVRLMIRIDEDDLEDYLLFHHPEVQEHIRQSVENLAQGRVQRIDDLIRTYEDAL